MPSLSSSFIFFSKISTSCLPCVKNYRQHLSKNYKTVQKWRTDFIDLEGEIPEFARGRYQRMNAISKDENLSKEARKYVREKAFRKGAQI